MTAKRITPVHKVEIVHSWKEIGRTWSATGSATVVERCQHCYTRRQVLALWQESDPISDERALTESLLSSRHAIQRWEEMAKSINDMLEQLVYDTPFNSIDDVLTEIEKRCQGAVDGSILPYRQLQRWLSQPRRHKVRNLLKFVQGPVCNRCDRIFSHSVQLTLDHINGDRNNAHPSNLQLLCKDCNGDKDKTPPDERDVSPFTYEGVPCVHRLTCVEFHAIQRDCENAEADVA